MLGNIYEAKPRYELLDAMLEPYLTNLKFKQTVNVIIDLKQVYRKIFRSSYVLETSDNNVLAIEAQRISSDILNIIGHYRNYFYKQGKYSNFYFVYSNNVCEYLQVMNQQYKSDFYKKYVINDDKTAENYNKILMLKKVTKALSRLVDELPHCKFIDSSKYDEMVYMKGIISISGKNTLNVILSNDEVLYQLVNPDVVCLNISGIDTKLIDTKSLYDIIGIKTKLSYGLYNVILSIAGSKKYSISGVKGISYKKAVKILEQLVNNQKLYNTKYDNFPIVLETLNPDDKNEQELITNYNLIEQNFKLFTLSDVFNEKHIELNIECEINEKAVCTSIFERLNNTLFTDYPLDLQKMLKGEI